MNIDREVILDLVPVVLSGEASPATRQLVEEYAKDHAEIADLLSNRAAGEDVLHEQFALPKELEMKSLERTKSLIRVRSIILAVAIFLSLLPFSVAGGSGGMRWLWSGAETYAVAAGALAALAWVTYAILHRRLRLSGW